MRVKRLKMQSFRGIGDLTLEFDEIEPTVFIGINGVGKSSILDCLAILLSPLIELIQNSTASGRLFSDQDITNGHQETNNEITISLDSQRVTWSLIQARKEHRKDSFQLKEAVENYTEALRILKSVGRIGEVDKKRQLLGVTGELEELKAVGNKIRTHWKANSEVNLPLVLYYPVNRAVLDISLEIPEKQAFEQIDAYNLALTGVQIGFGSFFQWFRALEDLENEERRDNSDYRNLQLEAVRQAIYSLLPGFSNLRVRRSPLRMTVTKQGQELIINQLSDGEKCLLAMVGDLARRLAIANPSLSDPLQGSGVVLIDEIELHLHPKWQREIIPALTRTFPNCQFIVTTHSPQVLSQVKPDSIYILEQTDVGITAKHPESSYGRDSNRILEDLMDVPERPQAIKESLLELFRLIGRGELDMARQLHKKIADEIGADEPELVGASVSIRRREILNR
jgi:predicted ATP-binding protein involved in virulence